MDLNLYNSAGAVTRQLTVQDAVFSVKFAQAAVHEELLHALARWDDLESRPR